MARLNPLLLLLIIIPIPTWASSYFERIGWLEPDSHVLRVLQYSKDVEHIYQSNHNQLIWFDLQQSTRLEFQLEIITSAGFSPLFARQLRYLEYYRKSNRWHEYDLLATDTLLLYISYAEQAKLLGYDWFFESKLYKPLPKLSQTNLIAVAVAVDHQQLSELIEVYTPDSDDYQKLIDSYLHVVKFEELNLPKYTQRGLRQVGDKLKNREVLLVRMEMVDVDLSDVRRDVNWYDATLETAVKQFQRLHGLTDDGIIGPDTIRWLNISPSERLSILALNAERGRLWPIERDTIIVVNVPGFEMKYWYSGQEVFESKVVVGRKGRPTPMMTTKLDSLILNPTWNVPWKIMVEDIIPKVKEDPEYLVRQNIKIVPKWGSKELINPEDIDWQNMRPSAFPYRMTQLSGNNNALGLYKFNTPNRRAIYLHDTPSKNLFDEASRAFSSGCIRVEHADQFATRLLESQGLDMSTLDEEELAANKSIPLKQRVPVHIIYQTAWSEGGKIHYRDDIYRWDRFSYGKG
ncbi:murein L,D-transpeptidase [Vibrio coralliilyticus]|uniref:L,D-transpeptidase family protein n=1 Tax=Vibrio coralliilyticus TaxID=190893 RepID=UPI00155FD2C1|nr:L,D-transpeptidase family protein [Vibrio coralliilyticus]NRF25854.1 L,D-transpeptidase family protein [Vibrio coralliilyticus]NRF79957.1 L,D-transpeptidase family protein [Vibrio coralliilyticus]